MCRKVLHYRASRNALWFLESLMISNMYSPIRRNFAEMADKISRNIEALRVSKSLQLLTLCAMAPRVWRFRPFVRGILWSPVDSLHKGPVMQNTLLCHDIIMSDWYRRVDCHGNSPSWEALDIDIDLHFIIQAMHTLTGRINMSTRQER